MKITFDTATNTIKYGRKTFDELDSTTKSYVANTLKEWADKNADLNSFERDAMWMAYRYAIGRHTAASSALATDIAKYCYPKLTESQKKTTADDLRRILVEKCCWGNRIFHSDVVNTFARDTKNNDNIIDCICNFLIDNNITTYEQLGKYKEIYFELDNERNIVANCHVTEDENEINEKTKEANEFFSMFEDLFPWCELAHLFDWRAQHMSRLKDGTIAKWIWGYRRIYSSNEPLKFEKIRIPLNSCCSLANTLLIPDSAIDFDILDCPCI